MISILSIQQDMLEAQKVECDSGTVAYYTTRCPGKETVNEDACAIYHVDAHVCIITIADGMGGLPNGESASATIVHDLKSKLKLENDSGRYRETILDAVESANKEIIAMGSGSTLAIAEIMNDSIRPYHVGDAKILVVGQRGKIKLETLSHSPTEYAVESGYLEPEEALEHEDRHFISNMVGAADMRIEMGSPLKLSVFDTVLLASDGLIDNVHTNEIIEVIRKGDLLIALQKVIDLCRTRMQNSEGSDPSSPDDFSIVLYRRKSGSKSKHVSPKIENNEPV